MKRSELFSLQHYLPIFPEMESFDNIIAMVNTNSEFVSVLEPFQNYNRTELTKCIIKMVNDIEKQFFPFHELVTIIDMETVKIVFEQLVGREATHQETESICSFLDADFSYHLTVKIANVVKFLEIKK